MPVEEFHNINNRIAGGAAQCVGGPPSKVEGGELGKSGIDELYVIALLNDAANMGVEKL